MYVEKRKFGHEYYGSDQQQESRLDIKFINFSAGFRPKYSSKEKFFKFCAMLFKIKKERNEKIRGFLEWMLKVRVTSDPCNIGGSRKLVLDLVIGGKRRDQKSKFLAQLNLTFYSALTFILQVTRGERKLLGWRRKVIFKVPVARKLLSLTLD